MYDTLDTASTRSSEPSRQCSLCKKTFVKESTRKRHYYYCRSRRSDANASRRRSCVACVRAKTRCTWLVGTGLKTCTRCSDRGTRCEYDKGSRPGPVFGQDDSDSQRSTASSSNSPGRVETAEDLQANTPPQTYQSSPETFDALLDTSWDLSLEEINALDLVGEAVGKQAILPPNSTLDALSDTLVTGISSLETTHLQFMTPYAFNFRAVARRSHTPLVSLATRMLRSYPFMILEDGGFPPFLNPQMYFWAKAGKGPLQETLMNCVSLVQMFKSRTEANKNLVWGMIRSEQERILVDHSSFDQWGLLAALQALLIYCLLRIQDNPAGQDGFDASLLTTVNLVSSTLSFLIKCDCSLPADPNLAWNDWIFNESRRRTALVFRALNMLVDISTAITCYPATGFGLIPLPSKTVLWSPQDVGKWTTAFEACSEERTLYSLSEGGSLMKLLHEDTGIQQSVADWGEWAAEVGEMGTLAMVMGELLS